MMEAYRLTRKEGAPGIEGVTAEDYEANARSLNIELQAAAPPWERGRSAAGASHRRRRTSGRRLLLVLRVGRRRWTWQAATNRMPMAQAWVRVTKRAIHHEVRMRSKRQCKTGAIQLRTTATRTIKRHALNRTVNRQSSGAILAELKHRLYALLGAVCGIAAAGFVRGLHLLENLFDKIRERYTRHIIGMLLVGILMYALLRSYGQYYVDGVGYATVQAILLGQLSAAGLLLLLFF